MSRIPCIVRANVPRMSAVFLGVFFILTGLDKLFHYHDFLLALEGYAVVPRAIAAFAAYPVIFAELWVGVGLLVTPWSKTASLIAAFLLFIFASALLLNYVWRPESSCGCWFSVSGGKVNLLHVAHNLILCVLALFVWKNFTTDPKPSVDVQQ